MSARLGLGRIERAHGSRVRAAAVMGDDAEQPMRLVVEIAAAVWNDMIFVLVGFDLNAVGSFSKRLIAGAA